MLTNDKKVSTPEYWNDFYTGKNNSGQDNSNTQRQPSSIDRFELVINLVEGDYILDVGAGHARICKEIKSRFPLKTIIASDQSIEAKRASGYSPYVINNGYKIMFEDKFFDLIICTQTLTLMDDPERFLEEAKRVAKKIIITIADGEDRLWSQVKAFTKDSLRELLEKFGEMEVLEIHGNLILAKMKFNA